MSELHGPLITDPTSYESEEGDVLPIADIVEPTEFASTHVEAITPEDTPIESGEAPLDPNLAHKMGGVLVDPTSYEKDGDVLPAADIAEPDGFVAAEPVAADPETIAEDSSEQPKALTPTQIYDREYDRLYDDFEKKSPDTATARAKVIAEIGHRPEEPTE